MALCNLVSRRLEILMLLHLAAAVKLKIIYRLRSFNEFDVLASSATVKRKEKLWVLFFGSFCSCICCCEAEENLCAPYFGDFGVLASAATGENCGLRFALEILMFLHLLPL